MRRKTEIHPAWLVFAFIVSMIIVGTIERYDETAAATHSKECQHCQGGTL